MRSLRSQECGVYEVADILLGDHLYKKSNAIQWISVKRPEKRKVRIKGYQELQQMTESDPDLNDLYQANLLDNFYPNRICLYDFVKCDWILENGSKSHMKSGIFLHIFNDISRISYVV